MSVIDIVRENFAARSSIQGELREIDEAATREQRDYTDEESAKIAEKREALAAIDARIAANLEQETRSQQINDGLDRFLGVLADRDRTEVVDTRSIGERFADEATFNDRGFGGVFGQKLDFRAVTNATLGAASAGALTRPQRLDRIGMQFLDRRVWLSDMLPSIRVTQGSVEYVQNQTPLADYTAAEVAEGAAKPQTGPTFAVITEPTPVVATWVNMTRQAAQDVAQLQDYLDMRLRYHLRRRVDNQIVAGSGAGNIQGLTQRSGIVTYAPGAPEPRYKSIRKGITLLEQNESVPEMIVLNPADAELFDLSNDTSVGLHTVPDDNGLAVATPRTAWGLMQVRSNAIAAGTALLIDPMGVAILDRMDVAAYLTDSHASNFTSNILTLLLETRIGLALFDPSSVARITFNGTV